MSCVYVASSWRNTRQPHVVTALRDGGHKVYDFREPELGVRGFHWSDIDPDWQNWTSAEYVQALRHPLAVDGFGRDMAALQRCDACVLVMPCGRSAHLELGYAVGAGKRTAALLDRSEPELMYGLVDWVGDNLGDLRVWLDGEPAGQKIKRENEILFYTAAQMGLSFEEASRLSQQGVLHKYLRAGAEREGFGS